MDVVQNVEDVLAVDSDIHFFCPRRGATDGSLYYEEDLLVLDPTTLTNESVVGKEEREHELKEVDKRTQLVLDACTILAYDGEDAKPFQIKLKEALAMQLSRCDICVREYHRSRTKLLAKLEGQYEEEQVRGFMDIFDSMNKSRIKAGLDEAAQSLLRLPSGKRGIGALDEIGMYALFEALNCLPYLTDEIAMQESLDQPFQMCQTNKKIRLPNYPPGIAAFLYSSNEQRTSWAQRLFATIKRDLTSQEFDFSVKPFLEPAMNRVHISCLDEDFLPTFWQAMRLILSKSTASIISQQLRSMDANLWTISLEHFQIDKPHVKDLLECHKLLIEKCPEVYWDAMGAIQPQAVLDTMFKAPQLERYFRDDVSRDSLDWVSSLLKSIKTDNLVPPLRTVLDQMLVRFQSSKYSRLSRLTALEVGFRALLSVLNSIRDKSSRAPVLGNILELVAKDYLILTLETTAGVEAKDEIRITGYEEAALAVVKAVFALECRVLSGDRVNILQTKSLVHDASALRLSIWNKCMSAIKPGHPLLAASIISGTTVLLTMEPLAKRQIEAAPQSAETWNTMLAQRQDTTANVLLDRLQALSGEHLKELVLDPSASTGFFALLFSGNAAIHESTLDLLKTLSGEDSRRDSLMFMLSNHLHTTLTGTDAALETIIRSRTFAPCTNMLKLCNDFYSCLSDDADGLLRSDHRRSSEDLGDIEAFWQTTWSSLRLVFEQTEAWSNLGHDKTMMQDFCRATMDLADFVFDQFSLLSGSLRTKPGESAQAMRVRLLERPRSVFGSVTKWLRLRDDYLIIKAVQLTSKLLARFKEADLEVSEDAIANIKGVLDGKIKTKLTANQKAQLQRSLERCLGQPLKPEPVALKQEPKTASKNGKLDLLAWSAQAEKDKGQPDRKAIASAVSSNGMLKTKLPPSRPLQSEEKKINEFKLKRQREKEEADRRRAEALAKAKGLSAGSGVIGLGDIGKDHALKGNNVMVSSDEESDDDDLDEDLFGPKIKKEKIRRPALDTFGATLKPEQKRAPTKIQKISRSFKDMRARLAPDLQPLHRQMLKWDFFHSGVYPPNTSEHQYRDVSNIFSDPSSYQGVFQPLLTLEAWQGMVKARDENSSKPYEIKVGSRSNVDSFLEISGPVGQAENRELHLSEGDIILMSTNRSPADASESPHCLARIYRVKRQKAHLEVVYQLIPGGSMDKHLTMQATVYGIKVQSIIPLEREYGALQALQYYDLCNQIVRARPSPRIEISQKQVATYQDIWNVNRAQSEAINAALLNDGFSLIQGPPGSGKTKTIVAIVGGLLTDTLGSKSTVTKINVPGRATAPDNNGASRKLLVCAPSNAAVDELVMRLKEGVKTKHGKHHMLNVVRIGRSEAINQQVLDVTMDELVAKKLGSSAHNDSMRSKTQELFKQHEKVSAELKLLYERRDSGKLKGKEASDLLDSISSVRRSKQELGTKIDNVKDQERNAGREAELNRKKAQQAVLDQADVICATLSGSGHDMFQSVNIEFETVIIDEAAQCVEMSSLIPLKYGCIKCIMVGDPKQLPPTVFSKEAAQFQYEQSLFVRMQNNFPDEVYLLDTQYRMHPDISIFPSRTFYDSLLKDGPGMAGLRARPWHKSALLAPYRFFDVQGQHQAAPKGHSLINLAEIDVALALYARLRTDFGNYDYTGRIGIITPYKSQLRALKDRFSTRYGQAIFDTVEFNTTDAFQGRESEIIIFSCVRASPAGGIGFLQDIRRMNVGLTRAKSSLWVLGNSESLVRGQYWRKLVEDARARDSYSTGDILGKLAKPSGAFKPESKPDVSMHDASSHVSQMSNGKVQNGRPNAPVHRRTGGNSDRMEGVTYKFEDRVKKKRSAPDLQEDKLSRLKTSKTNGDIVMRDA